MPQILIIDDDDAFREGLAETLGDLGYSTVQAASSEDGLKAIQRGNIDAAFLDYRMPDADGIETLRKVRAMPEAQDIPIIILTAYATSQNTIDAMKLGALDHVTKPVGRKQIYDVLKKALAYPNTPKSSSPISTGIDRLIGNSEAMRRVQKLIGMASVSDTTVLIIGETGTGKEMVARALHENSGRASGPLITVNCAAIPENLLESELFGHVRGAFTGAVTDKPGCFRQASGGTLLLDEIGDMRLPMQAKILRVLQEKEILPVGASTPKKVDVRVLAATHIELSEAVGKGTFREDLFYRLNVIPIHLPALRERPEDVLPLAEYFLQAASDPPKSFTESAQKRLLAYPWPGNVRELKNTVQRLNVLVRSSTIEEADIAFLGDVSHTSSVKALEELNLNLPTAIARVEKDLISRALFLSHGNRTETAKLLGINRQLLYSKLKEHELD